MSDPLSLRIDLIPLTVAIILLSVSVATGVALLRRTNRGDGSITDLGTTAELTLVIVVGLVGVGLLFQGLFR
jgi:hypothetical protein